MWWRRPQPYEVSSEIGSAQDRFFAAGECDAAVTGMWACLDATWVNSPDRDVIAGRKPYQLKLATEQGWRIPRTCITNDPATAREFAAAERRRGCGVIYKPFGGTPQTWRETRLLGDADEAQLDLVRLAPVIFQEAIPGGVDIRVTIVGERIFAAEIRPTGDAAAFDFRIEPDAPIVEHRLPEHVEARLRMLMGRLGLLYGAVDLRLAPNGDYVFLEVNPAGQWLFIEVVTGQPISAALAALLMNLDDARRRTHSEEKRTVLA
jgi:glutathione synthase/RimK-type ligase-like ATP-grasp enzyme